MKSHSLMVKIVFSFLASGIMSYSFADVIYITCKTTNAPNWNIKKLYSKRPAPTLDQFVLDMMMQGKAGVLAGPPQSWMLDTVQRTLTTPEQGVIALAFNDVAITDTSISASRTPTSDSYSFDLNRITGSLTYTVIFSEKFIQEWKRTNGGVFPLHVGWIQSCNSSSKPRI